MNVNLYIIEDYENKTAFGPKKTNPIKPCPERIEFTLSVIEGNGPISKAKTMLLDLSPCICYLSFY
jgi:hypothetical protein